MHYTYIYHYSFMSQRNIVKFMDYSIGLDDSEMATLNHEI